MTNIPYNQYIQLLTAEVELHKCQRDEKIYLLLLIILVVACMFIAFKLAIMSWHKQSHEDRLRMFVSKLVKKNPDFCLLDYGEDCPFHNNKGKCKNHILSFLEMQTTQ